MEWKEVGKSLLGLAPTLATALGGPVGLIAGGAIKVLTKFLGLPDDASAQQTAEMLKALSPDQWKELQLKDLEFSNRVLEAGVDLEKIAAADRDSARDLQKATGSWVPGVLMMVLTIGFFGMLMLMWYRAPADGSKDLLLTMIGSLGTAWIAGVTFYFGSSQGSAQLKDILRAKKEA